MAETPLLTASYKSPIATQSFSHSLPALPKADADNVDSKTDYLAALRANAVKLQGEINEFLTKKMEEDKADEGDKKRKVDEAREEEMYGEEDPEKDG